MKLGISSNTFPWAIGVPGSAVDHPLKPLQLLEKAQDLGVGLVQFGPNLPLDSLSENELRDVVKHASAWKIDLEIATRGIDISELRRQIRLAKRVGAILLKTTPERPDGQVPGSFELTNCLRDVAEDLAEERLGLAIDNSRIPAQELNEILGSVRSPWLGAAVDTARALVLQGWRISIRVLGHRTLSLHLKDFTVSPEAHGMGFSVVGCPMGTGQVNVPWIVESYASLRIEPSAIFESWTPEQKTLPETIALEDAWAKQGVDYLRRFIPD
jgi:sugar phosphate isomerase/epimerase